MRRLISLLYAVACLALYVYFLVVAFQVLRAASLGKWGTIILGTSALIGIFLMRIGADGVIDWGKGEATARVARYSLITGLIYFGYTIGMLIWLKGL